jgi:hypothetical protein
MHLRTVHARELPVPAAEAGAMLDSLGGPADRLWPNETWPASALRLEQPLRVGSRGGHGAIRYHVGEYEPGRRVVFAFDPKSGLTGTHETRVDELPAQAVSPRADDRLPSGRQARTDLPGPAPSARRAAARRARPRRG